MGKFLSGHKVTHKVRFCKEYRFCKVVLGKSLHKQMTTALNSNTEKEENLISRVTTM